MQATLRIAALKAANLFSSKEDARYYLNGVLLQISARHVLYVATNGHQMLVHREDLNESCPDNTLLGDYILPRAALDAIKQRKNDDLPISLQFFASDKVLLGGAIVTPIDGTFPDWRRIIPCALDPEAPHSRPQFNLSYCADFAKAAVLLDYGQLTPHFHYAGHNDPCAITFGDGRQTFGVLMPVHNFAEPWAGTPAWANAEAPAAESMAAE